MLKKMFVSSAVGIGVVGVLMATPMAALAVTEGPFTRTVSCDPSIVSPVRTVTHARTGTLGFTQVNDTDGNFARTVWASSARGNDLAKKTVSGANSTKTWTGVAASNYTYRLHASTSHNCNGILPGNGNTDLTYKVSHT